jgi:hypothetical protein
MINCWTPNLHDDRLLTHTRIGLWTLDDVRCRVQESADLRLEPRGVMSQKLCVDLVRLRLASDLDAYDGAWKGGAERQSVEVIIESR